MKYTKYCADCGNVFSAFIGHDCDKSKVVPPSPVSASAGERQTSVLAPAAGDQSAYRRALLAGHDPAPVAAILFPAERPPTSASDHGATRCRVCGGGYPPRKDVLCVCARSPMTPAERAVVDAAMAHAEAVERFSNWRKDADSYDARADALSSAERTYHAAVAALRAEREKRGEA